LTNNKNRIPQLDGLRGIAILAVLLVHYFYYPDPTLSLLIGGMLLDARNSLSYFKTFYARRFYRIIPVYYLWILCFILLILIGGPFLGSPTRSGVLAKLDWSFFAHIVFLQNMWTINYVTLAQCWFSHTWSLAVEEQFYLVAPFLVWLLSRRRLTIVLLSVVVAAPLCRLLVRSIVGAPAWPAYRLMPCRADALAVGMLTAILWRDARFRAWLSAKRRYLYAAFFALLAGVVATGFGSRIPTTIRFTGWRTGAVGLLAIGLSDGVAKISWIFFEQPLLRLGHLHKY
jgi:peptidoglycan/LPS O-acetylase OafA/YrhL